MAGHLPNMPPLAGLGCLMGDVLQIWRAYGAGEADKPLKTVLTFRPPSATQLKQGVNEIHTAIKHHAVENLFWG